MKKYENYNEFVLDFTKVFDAQPYNKSLIYKAPVRCGKTYY